MARGANQGLIQLMLAIALAAIIALGGINSYKILAAKAKEQGLVTEKIIRWKQSYMALVGTQERFKKTYPAASSIPDLLTLASLLNLPALGLRANTDMLVLNSDESIILNGVEIGLTKLCLGTGQQNFLVDANSYDELLGGIDKLAHRADLVLDNISVVGDKDVPQARIGQLCILLRNE